MRNPLKRSALTINNENTPFVTQKGKFWKDVVRDRYLYLLLLPGFLLLFIFRYVPMYGIIISFKEYSMFLGVMDSPWVGWLQFERLFRSPDFIQKIYNTFIISFYKLIFGFPAPIILALMLNELKKQKFKRISQTVLYLPHFVSWVVFAGLIISFLNPTTGAVNDIIASFGGRRIDFLASRTWFRTILVTTDVYKTMGWGTIVYLAAMSSVDPALYEAAIVDGANRFKQARYITFPAVKGVIIILFILNLGNILEAGFQQIFLLYSPLAYEVGDIIDTFVYRRGLVASNYSLGAAAGLFKNVAALILILLVNRAAKLIGEEGLW